MVNTTEEWFIQQEKRMITIYMVILSFAMIAHILIIFTIYKRNKLARKRYRIVANISASDCCYCLFTLIVVIRSKVDGYIVIDMTYHVLIGLNPIRALLKVNPIRGLLKVTSEKSNDIFHLLYYVFTFPAFLLLLKHMFLIFSTFSCETLL